MFHNLLQREQRRAVRTMYYVRLAVVVCGVVVITVLFGAVALVPSYLVVRSDLSAVQTDSMQYLEDAEERGAVRAKVDTATSLMTRLVPFVHPGAVTGYIREAFRVRPSTIAITGFSYSHDQKKMVLYGSAETRAALVSFTDALEESELFVRATLPIGDLAANTDLDFHITLSLVAEEEATRI